MSKIKKALKKIGKAALVAGAGYAAMKGLKNRKENKAFLKTEGGDKSDMRDYGPFSKGRGFIPANMMTPQDMANDEMFMGAMAKKGGRIKKTKKGGRAVRKANRSKKK